jgi:hypothetical protein
MILLYEEDRKNATWRNDYDNIYECVTKRHGESDEYPVGDAAGSK